jgi:FAD-dependent urate hydroxylase
VHDLEPLHTWSRANVLLVGDAAHAPLPTSGQGACQALEDAWHLVWCLDGASGSLDEAFRAFTKIRSPKTAKLAEQGRGFARGLFATDPETCRLRNERAKASDPLRDVQVLATGWGQGLPMPQIAAVARLRRRASHSTCTAYSDDFYRSAPTAL